MRANLTVISSVFLVVLLVCLGCESETQTAPAETVQQTMESPDITPAPDEQPEPQPAEPPAQQEEPSQEEIEQAQVELEMMIKQQQAQPEPNITEPQTQITPEAKLPSPDDVIVTVNGEPITRGSIDELIDSRFERIMRNSRRRPSEEYLENMRNRFTQQITQGLIIRTLVDQQMKKHNIIVTEQQVEDYIAQMAARQNMTFNDFKIALADDGRDYDKWKERMQFDKIVGALKLAEIEGFGTIDVNQADALEYYKQNDKEYEVPEQVRASHILIAPEQGEGVDPNAADAAAREKARQLLEQIKAGADFAQLATENSACPSSAKGGDLGFQQRRSWVRSFSDAAFALQPGQVSDIVKTRFGYHIIKVTDRKEASQIAFDLVKDEILMKLQVEREADITSKYIVSLKDNAEIVYTEQDNSQQGSN